MWKDIEIIFGKRQDALHVEWLLSRLALQGCLDEKVKFGVEGDPCDLTKYRTYKDDVRLRTLSIKIEE